MHILYGIDEYVHEKVGHNLNFLHISDTKKNFCLACGGGIIHHNLIHFRIYTSFHMLCSSDSGLNVAQLVDWM